MPRMDIGDIAIAYDDHGSTGSPSALPVLFLHGAVQTRAIWAVQVAAVGGARRLVVPDLRGHGETSLGTAHLSIERMADDAFALLDGLGIEHVIVVGISFGGMVALDMASRAPDRVACLMLSNTPQALSGHAWLARIVDWLDPHKLLYPAFRVLGQRRTARLGLSLASVLVGPRWVRRTARHHFVEGFATMTPDAIVATYRAIVESRPGDLSGLRCVCLVVNGADDAPSILDQAEEIGEEMGASSVTLPAGHVANLDDPDGFNRLLLAFLARHGNAF